MPETSSSERNLRKAILALLKPLANFCLRHAVPIQHLIEAAKVAMVSAAAQKLKAETGEVTVSRLSVVTGLQRKDIARILREQSAEDDWDKTLCGRVLGQWEQDRRFHTKQGKPAVLSNDGPRSEFHDLVRAVTRNINPTTLLLELKRMGAVEESPRGVKYIKRGGDFSEDMVGALTLASHDIDTLITCVEENTAADVGLGNLHIRTEYDNIYFARSEQIRKWIIDRGKEFHKGIRDYLASNDKDVTPSENHHEQAGTKVVVQAFSLIVKPQGKPPPSG